MSNAMRKFTESARRTARQPPALRQVREFDEETNCTKRRNSHKAFVNFGFFVSFVLPVLTGFLICGCASQPADVVEETPTLEAPVVQPEPVPPTEMTSLQRYQEVNQLYQAEKSRSAGLETDLAQQQAGRQKAEAENEDLREQLEILRAKAGELDAMKAKLDEAQKASLAMENTLRDVRRELLLERLAGVKRDQTIVALKIERAKDARKTGAIPLSSPFDRAPALRSSATSASAEAAADKSAGEQEQGRPEDARMGGSDRGADSPPPKNPPTGGQDAAPAGQQAATEKGTGVANP